MHRIKYQQWSLDLYSSPNYFAALCNGDLWMRPMERLFCVGYDSRSGYLRFEPKQFRDSQSAWITVNSDQTVRVRCAQWIRPFSEDDKRGEVPVIWTQGENLKENAGIRIRYRCLYTTEPKHNCRTCEFGCYHGPQSIQVSIDSMSVTFEWLQQGLR
ncbi:hypothetical protein CLU79DRAFT_736691 [Phycomyces nitens]|nr:hypothetical protein CLU79DRAFT_736691 [Phycomyces nitens]